MNRPEKPRLNILGASGHGKVVADVAKNCGYTEIYFFDDDRSIKECAGYPVVGTEKDLSTAIGHIFIAIGNAKTRQRVMEKYKNRNFPVLIHPSAVVADSVEIGDGTVVMAGSVINPGVRMGRGCIINTSSSIDHDCMVDDFCHIAVGAHLCGTVTVGAGTWIGAGATVSNNVNICSNATIGAGAVAVHDIEEEGTYIGVPAKKMSKQKLTGGGYCSTRIIIEQVLSEQRRRAA